MDRTLDAAFVKQLRELFASSGKRIAIYFKEGVAWPQILSVYRNQPPPTKHPNHPDFTFGGWVDLKTGDIRQDVEVDTGGGYETRRRTPLWREIATVGLGLVTLLLKIAFWSIIGIVMIVMAFSGGTPSTGFSRR